MDLRLSWERRPARIVTLTDGTTIVIRALRAADSAAVRRWFRGLSANTRYQRFHTQVTDLSEEQWHYLLNVDGIDHVALLAMANTRVVGVGRLIVHPGESELAFLVDDHYQRRGVGSALRDELIAAAQQRNARRLCAHVLPLNIGIRRLLTAPALQLVADRGDVLELVLADAS
jgi:GNAT superfamily N-acetyltransferase